jgi:hypothetical protein
MLYVATQRLNIRREPRITSSNRVGELAAGTQREVHEVLPMNKDNQVWGRISEPDNHGIALWVCLENLNTKFMKPVGEASSPAVASTSGNWQREVDAFLRGLGYQGAKP